MDMEGEGDGLGPNVLIVPWSGRATLEWTLGVVICENTAVAKQTVLSLLFTCSAAARWDSPKVTPALLIGTLYMVGLNVTIYTSGPLLSIVAVLSVEEGKRWLAWFGEKETCLRCGWRVHWACLGE